MFSTSDTIAAIATAPGRAGIGVVRVSGADAHRIAQTMLSRSRALEPRRATVADIAIGDAGALADRVVATYFPSPASYTGEDVVEVSAHGSPVLLRAIVEDAIRAGARLAEPGEFTLRAYLNGRMDLMQAEAVADLVDAVTPLQARAAFDQLQGTSSRAIAAIDQRLFELIARLEASVDFPEEGYHFAAPGEVAAEIGAIAEQTRRLLCGARRGRLVREGLQVAIVGRPNVGKSTLFNALVGAERAIVTDVPGTTRDLITEAMDLDGLHVTLVDSAGLRDTADAIEAEGVARTMSAARVADLLLHVVDASQPDGERVDLPMGSRVLPVVNKCDLEKGGSFGIDEAAHVVRVSALTGDGLDELRRRILAALDVEPTRETPAMTNVRHIALVERADEALARAERAALADGRSMPEEFVLADLQDARAALEEVTGKRASEDLLAHIFSTFCIGK